MTAPDYAHSVLDGRVAIVTGNSSGLGQRFADVLAGAGARVVLASRRHERDVELAGRLPDALPVRCDVRSPADPEGLVTAALDRFGRVDLLVNNAGAASSGPAEDESRAARAAAAPRGAGRAAAVPGERRLQLRDRADTRG